jgi:hypothetical protein
VIGLLKRTNRFLLYAITGVMMLFAVLSELLMIAATSAYTTGTGYATLLIPVGLVSVVLFALISKALVYVAFRISNILFIKKSGRLYPFSIPFGDFEKGCYAFLICGLFLCGVVHLPAVFFPSFGRVLSAIRTFVLWGTLVLIVRHFLKNYSHDYDKKTLAYSLILLPLILLSISLALTLVEVLR